MRRVSFWLDDTYVLSDWSEIKREDCLPYWSDAVILFFFLHFGYSEIRDYARKYLSGFENGNPDKYYTITLICCNILKTKKKCYDFKNSVLYTGVYCSIVMINLQINIYIYICSTLLHSYHHEKLKQLDSIIMLEWGIDTFMSNVKPIFQGQDSWRLLRTLFCCFYMVGKLTLEWLTLCRLVECRQQRQLVPWIQQSCVMWLCVCPQATSSSCYSQNGSFHQAGSSENFSFDWLTQVLFFCFFCLIMSVTKEWSVPKMKNTK